MSVIVESVFFISLLGWLYYWISLFKKNNLTTFKSVRVFMVKEKMDDFILSIISLIFLIVLIPYILLWFQEFFNISYYSPLYQMLRIILIFGLSASSTFVIDKLILMVKFIFNKIIDNAKKKL